MTCEYPGQPECREVLREYFEVDGRMLCDKHAGAMGSGSGSDGEGEEEWRNVKATRRVTRFIDLAGGNNSNNNGNGGNDEDSRLR